MLKKERSVQNIETNHQGRLFALKPELENEMRLAGPNCNAMRRIACFESFFPKSMIIVEMMTGLFAQLNGQLYAIGIRVPDVTGTNLEIHLRFEVSTFLEWKI